MKRTLMISMMLAGMVHAGVTMTPCDSFTITGVDAPQDSTAVYVYYDKADSDELTAEQSADYVIFGKDTTENDISRVKVKGDVFADGSTIVIAGGSYTEGENTTEFSGSQLFLEAWGTKGITIDNDIIIGNSSYKEEASGYNYGGALRLHESAADRKIVLKGAITLLDDAHFSVGTSGTAAKDQTYIEGNIAGAGKNLTIDTYYGCSTKLSGGATLQTLSGTGAVILDEKKNDGSTDAGNKNYTMVNATGSGTLSVDPGVTLNLLGHAENADLQNTSKNITNYKGIILIGDADGGNVVNLSGTVNSTADGSKVEVQSTNTLAVSGTLNASLIDMSMTEAKSSGKLVVKDGGKVNSANIWSTSKGEINVEKGGQLTSGIMIINAAGDSAANIKSTAAANSGQQLTAGNTNYTLTGAALTIQTANDSVVSLKLVNSTLTNNGGGTVRENNAQNTSYLAVNADKGNIVFAQKSQGLSVGDLTLSAGKSVKTWTGTVDQSTIGTLTVSKSLTAAEGASILNNLTLQDGVTLDFAGSITLAGVLTLGNELTLSEGMLSGESLTLFTGVTGLNLGTGAYTNKVDASTVFSGVDAGVYELVYSNSSVQLQAVPEPTTATLSLLALAGLAARRRRR